MEVIIMFDDLSVDKQNELLEAYGIDDPEAANWDVIPVTTIYVDPMGDLDD